MASNAGGMVYHHQRTNFRGSANGVRQPRPIFHMAFIPSLAANSRDLTFGASQSKGAQFYSSRQLTNLWLTLPSRDNCVSQSLCNPETWGAYKFNGGNQWPLLVFFRAFPCPIQVTFLDRVGPRVSRPVTCQSILVKGSS